MHFRLSPLPGKPQVHKQVKAGHLGPPYPRSRTQRKGWLPLQAFKLTPSPPHPPPQPGLFQVIKNETLEGNKTSPLTVFSLLPSELLKPVPRSSPEPLSGWKGGRRSGMRAEPDVRICRRILSRRSAARRSFITGRARSGWFPNHYF